MDYITEKVKLLHGDCLEVLKELPDNSVDSVVADPPYGLAFMGKKWDYDVPGVDIWQECLRVLKPGGHLLSFAGSRTYHRMTVAIEDAGFEIRDQIMWVYGSGWPKSMDVSKAIDKAAGAEREVGPVDPVRAARLVNQRGSYETDAGWSAGGRKVTIDPPATDAARQWQGWGTALKPSFEPLCIAQKPLLKSEEQHIINENLMKLEARLWLLSFASVAEKNSTSNQSELSAVFAIAQWTADELTSTREDLSAAMDISQYVSAINTCLNTVTSWRNTLGAILQHGNTSITETKSSTITDWKTLNFCLSQITPRTITTALCNQCGQTAFASTAERYFDAELKKLNATLELSVLAPAMLREAENCRDVDEKVKHTPICVARKPLIGTVAANVLEHGTGAINIDGCRVPGEPVPVFDTVGGRKFEQTHTQPERRTQQVGTSDAGRWPANFIHDGSEEVTNLLGDAARFFYCAKASKKEREVGLDGFELRVAGGLAGRADGSLGSVSLSRNIHPTVKPIDLMRYLCRLVTPPGGVVLDPFLGSGSTGVAALAEGFRFIGIEREEEYMAIATARLRHAVESV